MKRIQQENRKTGTGVRRFSSFLFSCFPVFLLNPLPCRRLFAACFIL